MNITLRDGEGVTIRESDSEHLVEVATRIKELRDSSKASAKEHSRAVQSINNDPGLSDQGKKERIDALESDRAAQRKTAIATEKEIIKNKISEIERRLDGYVGYTSDNIMAFRDAQDRAENITSPEKAATVMAERFEPTTGHSRTQSSVEQSRSDGMTHAAPSPTRTQPSRSSSATSRSSTHYTRTASTAPSHTCKHANEEGSTHTRGALSRTHPILPPQPPLGSSPGLGIRSPRHFFSKDPERDLGGEDLYLDAFGGLMAQNGRSDALRKRHRARIAKSKPACHICGMPIDYSLKYPDPKCFVVDHLVPIAKGVPMRWPTRRQRITHECNSKKRARDYAPIIRRSGALD